MAKQTKKAANALLSELGIRGNFQDLVRKGVIQGWDENQFAEALIRTKAFKRAYPGLVVNGSIHVDFSGGRQGTAAGLLTAAAKYNTGFDDFQAVARNTTGMNVNKRMFATAVRNDISPDEFGARLQVGQQLQNNPGLQAEFNAVLKAQGANTLDDMGIRKFLVRAADPKLYDTYEAAYLRSSGLDITRDEALGVAKGIGASGQVADLGQILSEINRIKPDIAPELRSAGVTDADLALLAGGKDPRNLGPTLEGIVANRRALRSSGSAYLTQTSSGGTGLSTNPEDDAASY